VPVVRTYTNSQMVSNVVVVPVYGLPSDEEALAVYRAALPGRLVVGIDANDIIVSGGAWHCVALEVPMVR
jgi:agmatine deiminase